MLPSTINPLFAAITKSLLITCQLEGVADLNKSLFYKPGRKNKVHMQHLQLGELVQSLQRTLNTAAQTERSINVDRDNKCINLLKEIEKQTPRPLNKHAMYLLLYGVFYPYSTLIMCDLMNSKKLGIPRNTRIYVYIRCVCIIYVCM